MRVGTSADWCGQLRVYNSGKIGADNEQDLRFNCDDSTLGTNLDDPLYDGSFLLCGDSNSSGVIMRLSLYEVSMFLSDPAPVTGTCGFDHWRSIPLGAYRAGGCPGVPVEITGQIVACSYVDSFPGHDPPFPPGAGIKIIQTVVSTEGGPYGNFVLYRWEIRNRGASAKGPWQAGSFIDWDVSRYGSTDVGAYSDAVNGYFIWNFEMPGYAFGMLDPNQTSKYQGAEAGLFSPFKIAVYDRRCFPRIWECFFDEQDDATMVSEWSVFVHEHGSRSVDHPGVPLDRLGLLLNAPITLEPHGSTAIHQAMFWVDATSNDPAIMEASAVGVAHRAARWAGFARGDVNDDGFVDLADVCWLRAGLPIYPDQYSGDVDTDGDIDAADAAYLLNYVSGLGPAPRGEWRFILPPNP